jgi:predicted aspartyl protease
MSVAFNPQYGMVYIPVELEGPARILSADFILDTGASRTVVAESVLRSLGYDPAAGAQVPVNTGAGAVYTTLISLTRIKALGQERQQLQVLVRPVIAASSAVGLLGLDFFRGLNLNIDFRQGQITLT